MAGDLFAPGASYCTGRIVDILSLKRRVPTFTLDCTDAFHQAPVLENVVVEPPEEYLNRLRAAGMCTNIWWKPQKQLPGRRQAGQRWVDHFTSALVVKLGFTRCVSAPQFFWNPDRQEGMEVRMDDVRPTSGKIQRGLAKDVPTPSVPAHKERLTTGELLSPSETTVYRQCVGGLLYYMQDRADAPYEVSILGSMLGKPTEGSMIALKRVTRYLKGDETLRQQACVGR